MNPFNTPSTNADFNGHATPSGLPPTGLPPTGSSPVGPTASNQTSQPDSEPTPRPVVELALELASAPGLLRRLAAQWKAPRQAARGAAWEHDPLPRARDEHENPQQRDIVFLNPAPGSDKPVAQTPKANYLARIGATHPIWAEWLHDYYDECVLPALKRYNDAVREQWERLAGINAEIERHNAALEARRAELEAEAEEKTRNDRAAILQLDEPLRNAHRNAAHKAARAGVAYDPEHPTPNAVLRHQKRPEQVFAGGHGIPWTPGDKSNRLHKGLMWGLTVGTGVIIGLSLFIVGTFLEPDALGEQWGLVVAAAAVGFIVACGGGWAVRHFSRAASERYYLAIYYGRGPFYWIPSLLVAIGVISTVIGMDAAVEFAGLLKAATLEEATNSGAQSLPLGLAYLVGMVITFGYVLTYAREGALDGRYHPCLNRLLTLQDEDFAARDKEIRTQPVVQEALHAIALVQEVLRHKSTLEMRVEATTAPLNAEIARLESLKCEPQRELSLEARRSIQDAHDNWVGAHSQYVHYVMVILAALEPIGASGPASPRNPSVPQAPTAPKRGGFLHWLRRHFGGGRPASPRSLEGTLR